MGRGEGQGGEQRSREGRRCSCIISGMYATAHTISLTRGNQLDVGPEIRQSWLTLEFHLAVQRWSSGGGGKWMDAQQDTRIMKAAQPTHNVTGQSLSTCLYCICHSQNIFREFFPLLYCTIFIYWGQSYAREYFPAKIPILGLS